MSISELATSYAALILHDNGHQVTSEKLMAILKAANVNVESYWPNLFERALKSADINALLNSVGSGVGSPAPATSTNAAASSAAEVAESAPAKEESKPDPESDDDMAVTGLFGDDF